ncbi:disease resistance protein RPV1-like isoform X2 [Humulus lupulus]|uniref:disease resistance protein RPV1-like isoform X2 n=1 Tax=Humulus lupulus TaxID=3486 RepID=UPI002B40071D|nr:disease resistance protein RPV1-like isoform X2 [Humulus lupulus]
MNMDSSPGDGICSTSSFSFWSAITHQRHDVFLSFRGEDTRHGLTKDLHQALTEANIATFKDDINLEKGREIASELFKAIQASRIAVVVFSRNYATSGWCLDELVKIIECKHVDGQIVIPVFCDVSPDDVFHQMGSFAKAFASHEERFAMDSGMENKIGKWRAALTEAASSSPVWDLQTNDVSQWHVSKFLEEIVSQISCRRQEAHMCLHLRPQTDDYGKDYLNLLLSAMSDDVLVIGLHGTNNLGKTDIAKAAYNKNFLRFKGSCYLANVSAVSKKPNGLVHLQERLLSDILIESDDDIQIEDVSEGIKMIQTELQRRRVLVVLDDVDSLEQLNALARKRDWFGPGSRVIITTRDAKLLSVLEAGDVYGPQGIQVIRDKYEKNLETIKELEELIQKITFQGKRKERFLLAEIERERRQTAYQVKAKESWTILELESLGDDVYICSYSTTMTEV